MGVLLLINKRGGDRFTVEEEGFASDIAETLGLALRNQSQLVQRRPTKFDYLIEQQMLSRHDLSSAMAEARRKRCESKPSCSTPTASPKPTSATPSPASTAAPSCPLTTTSQSIAASSRTSISNSSKPTSGCPCAATATPSKSSSIIPKTSSKPNTSRCCCAAPPCAGS